MATTLAMPQLGESVVEGTVGKWLVKEGDRVEKDQPVVEILTDKTDSEIPAPAAGVVTSILAKEGSVVAVGQGLCVIDESATASAKPATAQAVPASAPVAPVAAAAAPPAASGPVSAAVSGASAPPSVRKLAREQGVDVAQLTGRVSKNDVVSAATRPTATAAVPDTNARKSAFQVPPYVQRPGDEVIPFSRRRRIIADHMVYSKLTAPHVVTVAECDLQRTANLRETHKAPLKKEGINLTYLAFIAAATVKALRETRELNARVLDDAYVLLRDINLGVAVDTPEGLVVPVIRNADGLTVRGLAKAIDDIAKKARDNKLTPDDLAGKTFTISNPGLKGNLYGGAIISQPNVGILRIGEIQKRVVVVERDDEDVMAIHPVMYMALSYDHRIVDGVAANAFLYRVVELLEAGEFEI